jgi:hypothetical protein
VLFCSFIFSNTCTYLFQTLLVLNHGYFNALQFIWHNNVLTKHSASFLFPNICLPVNLINIFLNQLALKCYKSQECPNWRQWSKRVTTCNLCWPVVKGTTLVDRLSWNLKLVWQSMFDTFLAIQSKSVRWSRLIEDNYQTFVWIFILMRIFDFFCVLPLKTGNLPPRLSNVSKLTSSWSKSLN